MSAPLPKEVKSSRMRSCPLLLRAAAGASDGWARAEPRGDGSVIDRLRPGLRDTEEEPDAREASDD
jgi:hypothetical protein